MKCPSCGHEWEPEVEGESKIARAVFEHWCLVMAKTQAAKLNAARSQKIRARLREGYTADDMKAAINGCRNSRWHMGENPARRRYDDLTMILRDGAQLEQFRDLVRPSSRRLEQNGSGPPTDEQQQRLSDLAVELGESVPTPRTRKAADAMIASLERMRDT